MSRRVVRSTTIATAAAVTAALLAPAQGAASAQPAPTRDTVEVRGTVVVLAGEDGNPDRYSLLLPSGRTVELAEGFTAEPLSRFAGTVALPGAGSGRTLTGSLRSRTLARAASSGTPLTVVDSRVAARAPSAAATAHTTYVARIVNWGADFKQTDQQILDGLGQAQQWWVGQSGGVIPTWTTASGIAPVTSGASSFEAGCGLRNNGDGFSEIAADVAGQAFPGVDFSGRSPNHLVVVVPDGCGAGEASGRGRLGTSLANGGPVIIEANAGTGFRTVLEHEYGHNVGLQHANNDIEYGDLYEVMGTSVVNRLSPALGTIYRMEQGILAAGEAVDGSAGGTFTLAPRASASGQRGVHFINPDDGKRYFVDYRDGAGADAGTCYSAPDTCNYTGGKFGQGYRPGLVIEREDALRGAYLVGTSGGDGSLQLNETWTNQGASVTLTATGANTVRIDRTAKPPLPAGSVTIGAPTVNRQVTASVSIPGATAARYQWTFNGQAIPQADDSTYTPSPGMAGGTLGVIATGYAVGRDPSPQAQASQVVAPADWYASGERRYAEISGKARVGQTLTALGLDWVDYFGDKPAGYAPTYKWTRNGKAIKGATAATYRLTAKDLGKRIQVLEYPRATGFATNDYSRSESTRKVRIGKLASPRPTIGGKAKVGKRVVARTSGWTNGTKFRYQWFSDKLAIRGATGKKLRITRSLKGDKLKVKVTGTKKAFKKASATSRATKIK
ncbi:hypothetical protein [Nocardioides zhouii]|uniref:Uncharacterized protein n=1 Tax=Nocardioides zhouii TaxID=1168729 RepID=A0A4Q2T6N0_9ACTN|nr:hypothetical protein [Nocardioides zhouii]RYC13763.1 hypothetical protein EUA94_03940 [Nocardioides zhouii]